MAAPQSTEHVLFDGTRIVIRPMNKGDRGLVGSFVAGLSEESRYFRFKKQFQRANEPLLSFLTEVDQDRHVALIALVRHSGHEEEIGEARFVRSADRATCEFAIAIADAWQGKGVAGRLMDAIETLARDSGIAQMEGFILRTNRSMLRFARARGFVVDSDPSDYKSVHVVKQLS